MFLYADDAFCPGAYVGGFVVETLIARGSMSNVYRARAGNGALVALKVLHKQHVHDSVALGRFANERAALEAVDHPAVVRVLGGGELPDGLPFIALEWLQGTTLAERVEKHGPFSATDAKPVFGALCSAVEATHRAGLVHRDLKAENVMCLPDGAVRLLDFGIARQLDARSTALTSTGHVLGTPIALAPEQIRGAAPSPATDVYALGVLLHVMLTGKPPFEAKALLDLEQLHLHQKPPPLSARAGGVPAALDAVAARCLEKDAGARYPSVAELHAAFERALAGTGEVLGVAVSVKLSLNEDAPAEAWDLLDTLELDAVKALEAAGFTLVSQGVLLLGCRVDDGTASELDVRWRTFAKGLAKKFGGVDAQLRVHVSPVRVQAGRIIDGAVLRPLEWPATSDIEKKP